MLLALNEREASITRERLEAVFKLKLDVRSTERDATIYFTRDKERGQVKAHLTIYNREFRSVAGPELNGAHSQWYVDWKDIELKGQCVTADEVRKSLLASGWTSPWSSWGAWEKSWMPPNDPNTSAYPPVTPDPIASFHRRESIGSEQRDDLPRGVVMSAGDSPDSCVTAIRVDAAI